MKRGSVQKYAVARRSIEDIADYLAREANLDTALRFVEATEETFRLLLAMPEKGWQPSTKAPQLVGVRKWPIHSFEQWLVYYKSDEDGIAVLDVIHGALDPDHRVAEKLKDKE